MRRLMLRRRTVVSSSTPGRGFEAGFRGCRDQDPEQRRLRRLAGQRTNRHRRQPVAGLRTLDDYSRTRLAAKFAPAIGHNDDIPAQ
jgi:hypothetical protein